jgi:hypothetical protein
MLSRLAQFARKLWSRLASTANRLFRRITRPAWPNLVTGTRADIPRNRPHLLAEYALLGSRWLFCLGRWQPRT